MRRHTKNEKIARLKDKVKQGEYRVPSKAIAQQMVRDRVFVMDLLGIRRK